MSPSCTVIAGDEALAAFRQRLTGAYAFELLDQARGRLLVQLPVGVGKTEWLRQIILHALTVGEQHDLVVVLVPRWDVLRELLARLPASLPRVVLHPRPRQRCGDLEEAWKQYEQCGCGALGRMQICGGCPHRSMCFWPRQYGKRLRGTRLILATQQHLIVNPDFVTQLLHHTRASDPLVMIDESDLLVRSVERIIQRHDLEHFIAAQRAALVEGGGPVVQTWDWLNVSRRLAQATTPHLRHGGWDIPWVNHRWATAVQREGLRLFGSDFRFLGYQMHHFAQSDGASRERLPDGDLRFAALPDFGSQFIIFSGSIARDLARYRLDPDHDRPALLSPFEQYRFEHPDTRWLNLGTLDGAAKFFPGNAARILDFFAGKIAANIRQGKRTLLVSRKMFMRRCRDYLRQRLNELGVGPVHIVTGNWKRHNLQDPRTLALINYGVTGLNRFQHCEAAYCLNSYYVTEAAVTQAVQDLDASEDRYPIRIEFTGKPPRRQVSVDLPDARESILLRIAKSMLIQKEADVVVQAVGRVRPFTRPREVITFHAGALPGVRYALEFCALEQARNFFGILTGTEAGRVSRVEEARRLRAQGRSRQQIADELDVSLSTVTRYLRR